MTKVKICGITNLKDARACAAYGADFLGFIFYKKSKRCVSVDEAKSIIHALKPPVYKVGVFVDEDPRAVEKAALACGLDFLQFHGNEPPQYLGKFRKYKTIKAIRVLDYICPDEVKSYPHSLILFDTLKKNLYGGTGEAFDWKALEPVKKMKRPFIVSGGLTVENVGGLVQSIKPFAVDAASGVEKSPGQKDHALVKKFIESVKAKTK